MNNLSQEVVVLEWLKGLLQSVRNWNPTECHVTQCSEVTSTRTSHSNDLSRICEIKVKIYISSSFISELFKLWLVKTLENQEPCDGVLVICQLCPLDGMENTSIVNPTNLLIFGLVE